MKKAIRRALFHLAVAAGPALVVLLGKTWRIRWIGGEHLERCRREGGAVIYALWHGRLLPLTFSHRNRGIQILISRHSDGEIIRRITKKLGCGAVRGSTGKRGGEAIRELVRRGRAGADLAITPDGPRGPRYRAQPGVVIIAQRSGLPILPLASACSRGRVFSSWDRFQVPAPFAKVVIGYGEPIRVPPELSDEEFDRHVRLVEERIRKLTGDADEMCGRRREFT